MNKIKVKTSNKDKACTLATDLHAQGRDVAVYQDKEGTFYVMSAEPKDGVENGPRMLVYEPAKGTDVITKKYRGPERRKSPRVNLNIPVMGCIAKAGTA